VKRLAPLAVAAVAAAYFGSFVPYGINLEDEGLVLAQIARTVAGQVPYVDFHTGYTPGTFYLNALLAHLFGASVLVFRSALVAVNAATVALLFTLARPYAGTALAAVAALGWAAFLPCFVGEFASFDIPYPAWYAALAWLAAQAAFDRHLRRGGGAALVAAGLGAGLAFAFKPNVGVLAVLACGVTLAFEAAGAGDPDRPSARALLVLAAAVLVVLLSSDVVSIGFPLIVAAPIALVLGRLRWANRRVARPLRLWPAIGLVAAGALLPTLPWLVWLCHRLGAERFLRDVLLLGSGAERVYATPYPLPSDFPGGWALLAALGLAGLALAGLAAERRRVRVRHVGWGLALAGALVAALWWRLARMPEGAVRAIVGQVQMMGFFVAPPLAWVAVAAVLAGVRERSRRRPVAPAALGMVVFALASWVELYPRVDSMHLMVALPPTLVLGAAATRRALRAWAAALGQGERALVGATCAAGAVLALVAAVPNYAGRVAVAGGRLVALPQVALDARAAPVHVEAARASDVEALNRVLAYLRARVPPDAPLFGFPALGLVSFALGRSNPTPHDYFFPGRPDHRAEAEVIRALAAARPPYVVTLNRRLGFFFESPAYYFLLRAHVRQHYALAARFGRYDVLRRRRGRPAPAPAADVRPAFADPAAVRAALADPSRDRRRAAALAVLDRAGAPAAVAGLVRAWGFDRASELLLVRTLGEAGDARAITYLLDAWERPDGRLSDEAASALTLLAIRARTERYLFGRRATPPVAARWTAQPLPLGKLRAWLAVERSRRKVGLFAARALALAGDTQAVPVLREVIRRETGLLHEAFGAHLRIAAAEALVRLGHPEELCTLVEHLALPIHDAQDTMPSVLIDLARRHPDEAARCLGRGLASASPLEREMSAWVAGAVPLPALAPALRGVASGADTAGRIAAVWALGRLRDGGARGVLARLVDAPDAELRAFAVEALGRLGAEASS